MVIIISEVGKGRELIADENSARRFGKELLAFAQDGITPLGCGEHEVKLVWQYRSWDKDADWWADWKLTFEIHAKSLLNMENCTRQCYIAVAPQPKEEEKTDRLVSLKEVNRVITEHLGPYTLGKLYIG